MYLSKIQSKYCINKSNISNRKDLLYKHTNTFENTGAFLLKIINEQTKCDYSTTLLSLLNKKHPVPHFNTSKFNSYFYFNMFSHVLHVIGANLSKKNIYKVIFIYMYLHINNKKTKKPNPPTQATKKRKITVTINANMNCDCSSM